MKHRWLARASGVLCAVTIAMGVMSTTVFAGTEGPVDETVYLAALPEPTFVVLDPLPQGVDEPLDVTDNRQQVPLYFGDEAVDQCPIVDGVPWVRAGDFCRTLGGQVAESDGVLTVTMEDLTLTAEAGQVYFACNGRYLYVAGGIPTVDGQVILPLEALAVDCLGLTASWNRAKWQVTVLAEEIAPIASGEDYYNKTDLYWLSHLIGAKAGGQSLEVQAAVGSVCVNRLRDPSFKGQSSIYEVIFAKNQFDVVANGMIYTAPDATAILAAKLALEGCDAAQGATYVAASDLGAGYECVAQLGDLWFLTAV